MNAELQTAIAAAIEAATAGALRVDGAAPRSVGGGCINRAWRLDAADGGAVFIKTNRAAALQMFEAESEALAELSGTNTICCPRPICHGEAGGEAFLALEWIEMSSRGDGALMGRQLAALHRMVSAHGRHGWHRDNVIGETPQVNDWSSDWAEFFVERRLRPQFRMAAERGGRFTRDEDLVTRAAEMLASHQPIPSLLHGDLWGGNASFAADDGRPVVFDPATYYGDRETDLAFSEMFGGFSADFYRGYDESFPIDPGYDTRKPLYNLYHVLNHYNLFGGGYAAQAEGTIGRLLDA